MATQVTINGSTFNIPNQGSNPPWGEELSDLLIALVNVVNSTSGSADILLTNFNVANNQASAANVTGASWDTSQVRSFIMEYSIYRSSTTTEMSEVGNLYGTYKTSSGTWDISQTYGGTSGIVFSITPAGQLQYISSNFSGSSYVGKLKFKALAFLQT
jgi:hypothetical protein